MSYDDALRALKRGDYLSAVSALVADAAAATRIIHVDTITPVDAASQPGVGPTPVVLGASGTVLGLQFDQATEVAYRLIKIPTNFVGDASFHVHWSKNVNTNQANATVRWQLKYTVFNGTSNNVVAATGTIVWDVVYTDSGTTSRVVYRTPNMAATGFVPGYYVGISLSYIPAQTTLSGGPVCVSCDTLMRVTINSDS